MSRSAPGCAWSTALFLVWASRRYENPAHGVAGDLGNVGSITVTIAVLLGLTYGALAWVQWAAGRDAPYVAAVGFARAHPVVQREIGGGFEARWVTTTSGRTDQPVDLELRLYGYAGDGILRVHMVFEDGRWRPRRATLDLGDDILLSLIESR